jgi:hypothetical protein
VTLHPAKSLFTLADADTGSILGWSLVLVLLLLLMFGGIGFLRKWMAKDDQPAARVGFTLGDLRQMHQQGQITDEEFEKAKIQMIAATKRAAERDALRAIEAAKATGATSANVTDIEELRRRAKKHREGGPNLPGSPGEEPTPEEPPV